MKLKPHQNYTMTFKLNRNLHSLHFINLFDRIVDSSTRAIALNNQLSIAPRANPFENHRLHSAASAAFTLSKPFLAQSVPFFANSFLLSSRAHKSIDVSHKLHHLDYTASLIRIHLELEGTLETAVLDKMESIFHRDEKDVAAALMLIQSQMQKGIPHAAAVTLEKLFHALKDDSEVKYAPGLVSLAVRLFPQAGKEEKATTILTEAKAYWSGKDSSVRKMLGISANDRIPASPCW